jgi:hypothetical protein
MSRAYERALLAMVWSKFSIIAILILALALSCSKQSTQRTVTAPTQVAKVRVSAGGEIYFNERTVTLDQLRTEFQSLQRVRGGVWYLDESSGGAFRQQGQTVKKEIIEARLPIRVR